MSVLETELKLKVFAIPHGRPVPGLAEVRVKITKRKMYALVHAFRVKAGLLNEWFNSRHDKPESLFCDEEPHWLTNQGTPAQMTWFRSGPEPLFVSKTGSMHLMNMCAKQLVRSESYPLARLMADFGEDPDLAMLPPDRLMPGQIQGHFNLPARF